MATEWQDMLVDGLGAGGFMENVAVCQGSSWSLVSAIIEREGVERKEMESTVNVERAVTVTFSSRASDGVTSPAVGDLIRLWNERYATNDDADLTNATAPAGSTTYSVERISQGAAYKCFCKATTLRHPTALRPGR